LEDIIDKEILKHEKLIVMGDFNMSLNNKRLPLYIKRNNYLDPFSDYMGGSFPSRPEMRLIDHIFLKGFKCSDSLVDTKSNDNGFISDHNPIMCNIKY
jgi:endonuclease/exonuclease/phosphatase family metal-dependent hydrolase